MKEEFLHYIWKTGNFSTQHLTTTTGEEITILHRGYSNPDAGPDFFNCKIMIGQTLWAGNVEIHNRASEWMAHKHQNDPAYHNVILHVVWEEDEPILDHQQKKIPTFLLSERVNPLLLHHYERINASMQPIPCSPGWPRINLSVKDIWLERMLVERVEYKAADVIEKIRASKENWEDVFYAFLCRSMGLKVNAEPFLQLSHQLPLSILGKHRDHLFQLESLLFGVAGMLDQEYKDEYPRELYREYSFLRHKYKLHTMPAGGFKFSRMRPQAFPTLRMAELAMLIHRHPNLFALVIEAGSREEYDDLFAAGTSSYWDSHYRFDDKGVQREKKTGDTLIHTIIINAIVPVMFLYGKYKGDEEMQDKALSLLTVLPAEDHKIIRVWRSIGVTLQNAADTQGYLHLYKEYCCEKRCLDCMVGHQLLSGISEPSSVYKTSGTGENEIVEDTFLGEYFA